MKSFIYDVLSNLKEKKEDISSLTFILPSKRAGNFLKHEISNLTEKTLFVPEILSIEEFIEELSGLRLISNTELLFKFYSVYTNNTTKDHTETFETFSKWAQTVIQDFNEIDRHLITQEQIFDYLNAIQETNHWSLDKEQTPLIKNYLTFWKRLKVYYSELYYTLINEGVGYQGLMYRESVENLESYIQNNPNKKHIFIGFNALNIAESIIIKELLHHQLADIFWDIDNTILNAKYHNAGLFIKQYKKTWPYYNKQHFNWISNHYSKEKRISIIGVPKNIGQVKYTGQILHDLKKKNSNLDNTAVVLGDENLLIPLLNSIPKEIDGLNITMGLPLSNIPLTSLFEQLFQIHLKNTKSYYYKDIIAIMSHPYINPFFVIGERNISDEIIVYIKQNNILFLTLNDIIDLSREVKEVSSILFNTWNNNPETALNSILHLINYIKKHLNENKDHNLLDLEYVYRFYEVFNSIKKLNNDYSFINKTPVLYSIYREILSSQTLDFQGEPLNGLQIMGMLESRVLDFETVIISSVNEGILPAGKGQNSFIPFDVKLEHNLPTYKEKDAIYTYHFYRLLQRAKNIYLLYNTEPDVLNGNEKSRFITQLEIENIHPIEYIIVSPSVPKINKNIEVISKNEDILSKIKALAQRGFSPSTLTAYIRNPIDFYHQKILGIKEELAVEEILAANTIGTVIHNTLEDFYKPYEGHFLDVEIIDKMQNDIENVVKLHFKKIYKKGTLEKGKNLIIFEIAKRYISNFLNNERHLLKEGHTIEILEIETDLNTTLSIPQLEFPIYLTGKVDRIDKFDGTVRIIDYKVGRVEQSQVEITDWQLINTDYKKYSKSFQVLMYAYMRYHDKSLSTHIEAGIISFKNLSSGFLNFAKKESSRGKRETNITANTLVAFETQLKDLILEICDQNIDFIEKEV